MYLPPNTQEEEVAQRGPTRDGFAISCHFAQPHLYGCRFPVNKMATSEFRFADKQIIYFRIGLTDSDT